MPEGLEDPYFEWLHWPQSSVPFSEEELEYIANLDEMKDVDMLRSELPMLREACHRMLILSTSVLKKAAASGLCLAEIGELMSKDAIEEASQFELICLEAKRALTISSSVDDDLSELSLGEMNDELLEQFKMDEEEHNEDDDCLEDEICNTVPILTLPNSTFWSSNRGSWRERHQTTLSPLDEDALLCASNAVPIGKVNKPFPVDSARSVWPTNGQTFDNPGVKEDFETQRSSNNRKASLFSFDSDFQPSRPTPYRSMSLNHHKQRYGKYSLRRKAFFKDVPLTPAPKMGGKGFSYGNSNQVSFGDMSDEEWNCFLSCFNGCLDEVLATRRPRNLNYKRRLGTSCQF